MNNEWEMVREFHKAATHPCPDEPVMLTCERLSVRSSWMKEEIEELLQSEDLCDQVDAVIDLMYFALGTLVEMGIKPDSFFKIIHASNMEKVEISGPTLFRTDSKVMKPSGWKQPKRLMLKEINKLLKK